MTTNDIPVTLLGKCIYFMSTYLMTTVFADFYTKLTISSQAQIIL